MESGKVLLGVLGGVAVGALLGILFAPDKGTETRRKIADKGKHYADDLKEKIAGIKKEVSDGYESLLADAKDMASNSK